MAQAPGWRKLSWRSSTVEQLICNQQVVGSNPIASSSPEGAPIFGFRIVVKLEKLISYEVKGIGEVPEWPKGADCKSAGDAFEGSNPSLSTRFHRAGIAQLVERKPSKLGVAGSSPVSRSILSRWSWIDNANRYSRWGRRTIVVYLPR